MATPRPPLTEKEFLRLDFDDVADLAQAKEDDLIFATLFATPAMLLHGYRRGIFTMPLPYPDLAPAIFGWYFPKVRGVIPIPPPPSSILANPGRSLRKSRSRMVCSIDFDFAGVLRACKDTQREGRWIDERIEELYLALWEMGVGHSVEVWGSPMQQNLIGGLYGIQFGDFFAGESMFHRRSDASKVALAKLVEAAPKLGISLIDTQWPTEHLLRMGAVAIPWQTYLEILAS